MPLILVASAALSAVEYDSDGETLKVQFRDRRLYQYRGVPASIYEQLLSSDSKGAFFNRAIRGHFPYVSSARTK
jgi:lysyl-tRNA synthetase, class II